MNTKLGKVEVLGTSFNVRIYKDVLVVACKTGKVRVTGTLQTTQIITPGQKVKTLSSGQLEGPTEVDPESIDTWISGEIEIQSWALQEVFEEIERQFDIQVEFEDFEPSEHSYTGYLNRKNLKTTLDEMRISMGFEYDMTEKDRVIIKRRK